MSLRRAHVREGTAARRGRRRGFTLLEVLLTLALIGLMAGVLITMSIHLTEPRSATVEDVFWKAVGEARKEALLTGREVRLRFQPGREKSVATFVTNGPDGAQRFPLENEAEVTVDFLSTQKATSAILIRSQLVETQTIPFVTFYGDGSCTPFRVQIRTGGPARSLSIDPWTCAQVLAANPAPNGGAAQ
ncbi:hypothetical protein DB347_05235 [Opitutaceae bacterium EW11]|nr:hypothetical protein DB347_05235 [Opitutaceae bacterium EW11]